MQCNRCFGWRVEIDTHRLLTSYPPQYRTICKDCGQVSSIPASSAYSIPESPPNIYATEKKCEVCGESMPVTDSNVCYRCKEAIMFVRNSKSYIEGCISKLFEEGR